MPNFIQLFSNLPHEAAVVLLSMLPVTELRLSLPIALAVYKMNVFWAATLAVVGDIIPVVFLLFGLEKIYSFLSQKSSWLKKIFDYFFLRSSRKFSGKYAKYGAIALISFVAIPLPFTGAWSGAIAAFLFRIPYKEALSFIFIGVVISAIIVSTLTLTGISML